MDEDGAVADAVEETSAPGLTIKGASSTLTAGRKTLLERLAAAKAEAAAKTAAEVSVQPLVSPVTGPATNGSVFPTAATSLRASVQARLRLRLKLASEKKAYVYKQNESRAQALRAMILESKARRAVEEEDAVLRYMDRLDRAREIRRRLMVEKMMAAETESEKRARELKDKLLGAKRAKVLREQLQSRKTSGNGNANPVAVAVH